MEKTKKQKSVWYLVLIAVLILMIRYFEQITGFLKTVGSVAMPLAMGCGIAYVLNIIMSAMERHYFTRKNAPWVEKTRRPRDYLVVSTSVKQLIDFLDRS